MKKSNNTESSFVTRINQELKESPEIIAAAKHIAKEMQEFNQKISPIGAPDMDDMTDREIADAVLKSIKRLDLNEMIKTLMFARSIPALLSDLLEEVEMFHALIDNLAKLGNLTELKNTPRLNDAPAGKNTVH